MRRMTWLLMMAVISCGGPAETPAGPETEISEMIGRQVASWNAGDLDGYMLYYWNSPELTFNSGKKLISGWNELHSMYTEKYFGGERGVLTFTEPEVMVLSPESAYVTGRWNVQLPDTLRAGMFTLIVRKIDGQWRIVHDHSS